MSGDQLIREHREGAPNIANSVKSFLTLVGLKRTQKGMAAPMNEDSAQVRLH
jgi:hypothetical protein